MPFKYPNQIGAQKLETCTYKALLRPVGACTLPEDCREWSFVHRPDTLDGGRYGVIQLTRALTKDERDRFALRPY